MQSFMVDTVENGRYALSNSEFRTGNVCLYPDGCADAVMNGYEATRAIRTMERDAGTIPLSPSRQMPLPRGYGEGAQCRNE